MGKKSILEMDSLLQERERDQTPLPGDLVIGQCYYVRGPSDHWVGRLAAIQGPFSLTLTDASWVASSGRLHQFIRDGETENMEIEPVGEITVQWSAYLPWSHKLFQEAI